MSASLPPQDPDKPTDTDELSARFQDSELRLLEAEQRLVEANTERQKLLNRERRQKINLRRLAAGVGVLALVAICTATAHVYHSMFTTAYVSQNSAFLVALVTAPLVAITTITGALIVAAFGRGQKGEIEELKD